MTSNIVLHPHLKVVGAIIISLMLILSFSQSVDQGKFVARAASSGITWAHKSWLESETLEWLKTQDKELLIYTNAPEPISLYTGISPLMLPRHTEPNSRLPNENYDTEIQTMAQNLLEQNGVIIYFDIAVKVRW